MSIRVISLTLSVYPCRSAIPFIGYKVIKNDLPAVSLPNNFSSDESRAHSRKHISAKERSLATTSHPPPEFYVGLNNKKHRISDVRFLFFALPIDFNANGRRSGSITLSSSDH
jgi:hypothetical protein